VLYENIYLHCYTSITFQRLLIHSTPSSPYTAFHTAFEIYLLSSLHFLNQVVRRHRLLAATFQLPITRTNMHSSRPNFVPSSFKAPRTPMKMFADNRGPFNSHHHSTNFPSSTFHSSFGSDSSWESTLIATPTSTRRPSFDSVKLEDGPYPSSTPSCTPERYESAIGLYPLSSITEDVLSGFQDTSMLFSVDGVKSPPDQSMMPFYNYPTSTGSIYEQFDSNHGLLGDTPALDLDLYSPTSGMGSSPVSMDFVVPSQTTFSDSFDMYSPMRHMNYAIDFSLGNSPAASVEYFMPSYTDSKSTSTTPSRLSTLRQPIFGPLDTSTALQRVQQGIKSENIKPDQTARHLRRRIKREGIKREVGRMMSLNIRVQKQARKECHWDGCNGKFQRQEHLKRHEKTHMSTEVFPCQFCGKRFGRSDNLKSHIKLHADPNKKSRRTDYFPGAQRVVEEMTRKQKKAAERDGPPRVSIRSHVRAEGF
jgi:zinc finger protein BrlA